MSTANNLFPYTALMQPWTGWVTLTSLSRWIPKFAAGPGPVISRVLAGKTLENWKLCNESIGGVLMDRLNMSQQHSLGAQAQLGCRGMPEQVRGSDCPSTQRQVTPLQCWAHGNRLSESSCENGSVIGVSVTTQEAESWDGLAGEQAQCGSYPGMSLTDKQMLLTRVQWHNKRQWVQTEMQEIPLKHEKELFNCKS